MCDERAHDYAHGGENDMLGAVAGMEAVDQSAAFGHSRPSPVALTAWFQADCTCTSYK